MCRYLAVDYGSKRCGIAVSDPLKMIAAGLETVASHELMDYLTDYFKKEVVEHLIVGKPVQTDGTSSELYILAERFVNAFKKRFPEIPVSWEDERFTSKMAMQSMIDGGMKKSARREKGAVDKVSAAIILQSFMDNQK